MKKSTKGALAASAAGVLLLGGAGSLAYWSSDADLGGTTITSGHLKLGAPSCPGGWTLDGGTAFVAQKLVPGDTLTKVCSVTVSAAGSHLAANFDVVSPTFAAGADAALVAELTPAATYKVNTTPVSGTGVAIANNDVVEATITVTWPYGSAVNNVSNVTGGLSAVLDDITITATQTHTS